MVLSQTRISSLTVSTTQLPPTAALVSGGKQPQLSRRCEVDTLEVLADREGAARIEGAQHAVGAGRATGRSRWCRSARCRSWRSRVTVRLYCTPGSPVIST